MGMIFESRKQAAKVPRRWKTSVLYVFQRISPHAFTAVKDNTYMHPGTLFALSIPTLSSRKTFRSGAHSFANVFPLTNPRNTAGRRRGRPAIRHKYRQRRHRLQIRLQRRRSRRNKRGFVFAVRGSASRQTRPIPQDSSGFGHSRRPPSGGHVVGGAVRHGLVPANAAAGGRDVPDQRRSRFLHR